MDLPRDLGSDALTFRRLRNLAERLSAHDDSAFIRAIDPDRAGWTLQAHMDAEIIDQLRISNWMKSEDGQKGRNRPEPIKRPGVDPKVNAKAELIAETGKRWAERRRKRLEAVAAQRNVNDTN